MHGPAWLGKTSHQVPSGAEEGQEGKARHLAALPAGCRKSKAAGAVPSTRMHGMKEILQYSASMLWPSFSSRGRK